MDKAIGIVGLGRMGLPVGKLLIQKGFSVVGYDRDQLLLDDFAPISDTNNPVYKIV